ncbi:Uncharacterized membrane protein HdeD, DUF308 family [Rhodospirillales bacterium URHD0017]|nr:Uncharacterized membrane protein HdeD, DUF308 family [Rhodospirillales bacterium URHD0017]
MSKAPTPANAGFAEAPLLDAAADHASLLRWRGLAAIAFAFLAFFWPKLNILGLAILWGGYSFVDGVLALAAAIRAKPGMPRAWLSVVGTSGVACAVAVLVAPQEVAGHLVAIISAWAILAGTMQVWAASRLRKAVDGGWILALDGAGAVLFGVALVVWPRLEMVALVWLIGWFAALLGSLFLAIGLLLARSR